MLSVSAGSGARNRERREATVATQQKVQWASFLPYHLVRDLATNPTADLAGQERRIPAVALFADISGFTGLSEALAGAPAGAEELTALLNGYFTPIIALLQSYGGIVARFGGDSLTGFFPYEPDDPGPTIRRAVACALAVQSHVDRYAWIETSAGFFTLAMRIGLARGIVYTAIVGEPATRLEPIIAGSVVDRAAAAEAAAVPGEVVVDAALLPDLGWALSEPRRSSDGQTTFYVITRSAEIPDPSPLPPLPPLPASAIERVAAFLPPTIAARLGNGHAGFVGEHRAVTVIFLAFAGFDYDDPGVGAQLQPFLARLFQVVQRYGGYVNKVDMGDKGSTALILFGAPTAHEDDTARALQCALELRELIGAEQANAAPASDEGTLSPRVVAAGIAAGHVFSGQVGSRARQEYTVIGDAVTLAARLMQAAGPGEILAAESVTRSGSHAFAWGSPRQLSLRGRSSPVTAYPLTGSIPSTTLSAVATVGLVGRATEWAELRGRLTLALGGHGQIVGLRGTAGVGKSALAAALLAEAAAEGALTLTGECVSYRTASPYLVWRPILRGLLGLRPDERASEQAARVEDYLRALDQRLVAQLPLLGPLLELPLAESALTLSMEAEARKSATESLAGDLIAAAAARSPLVLCLESCQWIDPLSRDLLLAVARRSTSLPVLLLLAYRSAPEAREEWAAPLRAAQLDNLSELQLGDLEPDAAAALVAQEIHQRYGPGVEAHPALIERVLARTRGNPLFIVELLGLMHERGLDPASEHGDDLELPDSLHRLVLSRIDRLGEGARTVLKVASVVGQEFSPSWLAGIYPALGAEEQLDHTLEELRRADLAVLGHDGPDPAYLFRHGITREVAYESLSTVMRADLHARVGSYIEQAYADDLERFVDLLAHHYGLSDNRAKQKEYLLRAGHAAQAAFANEAAVSFYERLLPLLAPHERSDVLLRLGAVLRHMGRWDEAELQFREALRAANDQATAARCRLEQGDLLRRRGDPAAGEWLEAARRSFTSAGSQVGASEAERQLGLVALGQGDYPQALSAFEKALRPLADGGDPNQISLLLINLGAVFWSSGDMARALDCFERSLRLAASVGNRQRVGVAVGNLGGIYHIRGDFGRALDCYMQKLQCALEIGDRLEMAISIGNLGHIYEDQGEYERATCCYLRSLEIALELSERMGVGMALLGLGTVAAAEGDLPTAEGLIALAEAVFESMEATYELADCRVARADFAARAGATTVARAHLAEALALSNESSNAEAAHRCNLLGIELEFARGAISADGAVQALRALLEARPSDEQRAEILTAIVRIDGTQAAARAAAAGLYRALHMATPKVAYRRAYASLMGVDLPQPTPLPAPPPAVTRRPPVRASLIARAENFAQSLQGDLARTV